jgi:hypothetical protein
MILNSMDEWGSVGIMLPKVADGKMADDGESERMLRGTTVVP